MVAQNFVVDLNKPLVFQVGLHTNTCRFACFPLYYAPMPSLTGFVATITLAVLLAGLSAGEELRPSDHGLGFQAPPPSKSDMEMRSFFNSNKTSSSSSSSSDTSSGNVTESLPPWKDTGGGGRGRLGRVLLTASLACGITGGILLVVSGLLYLFKHKRRRNSQQNDSFRFDDDIIFTNNNNNNNNNNTNKLELVRNP